MICQPGRQREIFPAVTMQRLGKNHGGYHGATIDIRTTLTEIQRAADQHRWTRTSFHAAGEFSWLALHRAALSPAGSPPLQRVYLSAGIHGDEPAAPLAAHQLIAENQWPAHWELFFCPCLNPLGFRQNRRDNGAGLDLNRDYLHLQSAEVRAHVAWLQRQPSFDLCLCLHEDWESQGFYVYELNPDHQPSLAEAIVSGVERVCLVDRSEVIEGRPARNGIIRPETDARNRPQWPEAFWLLTHKTRLSYTLESPSDFALPIRVNALVAGVNATMDWYTPD